MAARRAKRTRQIEQAKAEGKKPYMVISRKSAAKIGRPKSAAKQAKKKAERVIARNKAIRPKRCGDFDGRTAKGSRCSRRAGAGTDHEGTGKCWQHGGANPSRAVQRGNRRLPSDQNHIVVDKAAPKNLNDAKQLLGIPIEMSPIDALMWCIRITAGEIQWYSERMGERKEHEWIEDTFVGKQLHMYARNRAVSIDRLAKYSKWAVDSGIAERAMRLAESYGEQLYVLLHGVLEDLELTPGQRAKAPAIITRHLMAMEAKNISNSPNQLISGADPETIVIEDAEVVEQ
jgi:hypothetical protein